MPKCNADRMEIARNLKSHLQLSHDGSFVIIIIALLESCTKYSVAKCKMLCCRMRNALLQNVTTSTAMTTHHMIFVHEPHEEFPFRIAQLCMNEQQPYMSDRHGQVTVMEE